MGGGKEYHDSNNQLVAITKDLETVWFNFLPENSNFSIFNYENLAVTLKKEISDFFKKNGIKFETTYAGDLGGGMDSLRDIFATLLSNWDLIIFIKSAFTLFHTLFVNYLEDTTYNLTPEIKINLSVISGSDAKKIDNDELDQLVKEKMSNLLETGFSLSNLIKKKHEFLNCSFSVNVDIHSIDSYRSMTVPAKFNSNFNKLRLFKIIKDGRVKNNLTTFYTLTKFNLIKRTDRPLPQDKVYKYYLMYSSRILNDYFIKRKNKLHK